MKVNSTRGQSTVKIVRVSGGQVSFVRADGGMLVFPVGVYRTKPGHQIVVNDGRVITVVLPG